MVLAVIKEEEEIIRTTTHSSSISFEYHHSIIFEELCKQADYLSDDESDDEEPTPSSDQRKEQERSTQKNISGNKLRKEKISVEGLDSDQSHRGLFQRIASDFLFCSTLKDEVETSQSGQSHRCAGSILSLIRKRIIDREIKAGKIVPAFAIDAGGRSRTFFSFTCRGENHTIHEPRLRTNENTEIKSNCEATFQDGTPQRPQ